MEHQKIKAARALCDLKQSQLAKTVGRSQAWISLVETGRLIPKEEQKRKIEELLKPGFISISEDVNKYFPNNSRYELKAK
jgi:ribosome-binding protein aMBF1 (putative translation factor)